ncbi:MAG: hypothetical protein ABIL01_21235 [Pseudomonadota bacterium]
MPARGRGLHLQECRGLLSNRATSFTVPDGFGTTFATGTGSSRLTVDQATARLNYRFGGRRRRATNETVRATVGNGQGLMAQNAVLRTACSLCWM